MDKERGTFQYTYCAQEQAEVESIRKKYLPQEENKLERIRRLDRGVTRKAQMCAITLGTVGALILGAGMSLCMTQLGSFLGGAAMLVGIPVGILGLVPVALAYPLYSRVLEKERQRIAPEILRLTEELMK